MLRTLWCNRFGNVIMMAGVVYIPAFRAQSCFLSTLLIPDEDHEKRHVDMWYGGWTQTCLASPFTAIHFPAFCHLQWSSSSNSKRNHSGCWHCTNKCTWLANCNLKWLMRHLMFLSEQNDFLAMYFPSFEMIRADICSHLATHPLLIVVRSECLCFFAFIFVFPGCCYKVVHKWQ